MTIYNFKNRVLISITRPKLKIISKKLTMGISKLDDLINKVLESTLSSTIEDLETWINQNVPMLKDETSYPFTIQDNLKRNLRSSRVVKGLSYRIKLGTFISRDIITPLNEDLNSPYYHFMERLIDYACERTRFHLEKKVIHYSSNENIKEILSKNLMVVCLKD